MIIQSHGLSCVSISAKPVSGDVAVVLDPYDNSTGLRFPRTLSADVVFSSRKGPEHGNLAGVQGAPFSVDMPGEYEVKGIMLDARRATLKSDPKHMILRISAEGMTIGFLGGLDREPSDKDLELLEGVDILILPVGGGSSMTPKVAVETIQKVEPRVVIPVYYQEDSVKEKLETLGAFKKELGAIMAEETSKYKITKSGLPQDKMELVTLTR